jgi:predicted PurR-regulated permease PerM
MVFGASVSRWAALGALAILLFVARGVLPPFIVAAILAYVLSPLVDELAARLGWPRRIAAGVVFVIIVALLALLFWLLGARLAAELRDISREGPSIVEGVVDHLTGGQPIELFGQTLTSHELGRRLDIALRDELGTPNQAIQVVRTGFELLLAVLLVMLSLAYMLADGPSLFGYSMRFIPEEHQPRVEQVWGRIHQVLGHYLRGQLLLIVLMTVVTFLVLEIGFHLPYALWVAVITGILEVIPLIGPIAAGIIACTIGFSHGGPNEAIAIAVVYVVLRQVEDQLVMPQVVGRTVHVHPLVTIFAVLTGEKIAGVLGMILAVPIAATIKVVLDQAYGTHQVLPPAGEVAPPHRDLPAPATPPAG